MLCGCGMAPQPATTSVQQNSTPAEMELRITASPDRISTGQSTTLNIWTPAVTTITLDHGLGVVTSPGTVTVSPAETTTYFGVINGQTGTSATVQVTVVPNDKFRAAIGHIIVLVQSGRSFDSYFGMLSHYRQVKGYSADVEGMNVDRPLQDWSGHSIKPYHLQTVCTEGLSAGWNESHYDAHATDSGYLMDRFMMTTQAQTQLYDPDGTRAMGYYDERDLPYYYELASQFTTSDRFYSSALADGGVNRMYLLAGTSFGHAFSVLPPSAGWEQRTIFDALNQRGVSWGYYTDSDQPFLSQFAIWNDPHSRSQVHSISDYYDLLARSSSDHDLPAVVFIEMVPELDEHARTNVQLGAAGTQKLIGALMHSSAWQHSALVLAFDEGGGFSDHVAPAAVPTPDDLAPALSTSDQPGAFDTSGFRVPFILVSPWARPQFVSHVPRDLTSILGLIERRFDVPPLTGRDAAADPMLELFDFAVPHLAHPPALPPQPVNGTCDPRLEQSPQHP
jgi:phospholipase C